MEISWPTHREVIYGPHLGYGAANQKLREAIANLGVKINRRGKVVVHLCRPDVFRPVKKRKNVLFTMYEGYPVPENFRKSFRRADLLATPSRFCKEMFDPLCEGEKFEVVPLGFDDEHYKYSERGWAPGEPFIWLWVGAPNSRKGWDIVLKTWNKFFAKVPWMHLFMKTTSAGTEGEVKTMGNVTFDSRRYTDQGLADLYAKCNAFVLPTAGEGWGLTLLEALVSGMPIVTTKHGGQTEFLDDSSAYFVDYRMEEVITKEGGVFEAAIADGDDLARNMIKVLESYEAASNMAKQGSAYARNNLTWEKSAKSLIDLIGRRI